MDIVTYALCKGHTDKAVDDIMDIIASMEKLTMTIVDELPSVDDAEPNVIYLIDTNHDNVYEEYVLIEIGGEKELVSLGDITDLSNYYNKIETDNLLAGKQATLTWDNVPTENSTNAVNSGVVYAAVQSVANTLANLDCVMSVTASNNVITVTYRNNTSSTITITGGIIPYDNTTSGLSATNVQSAIDEVAGVVEAEHVSLTQAQYDQLAPAEKNNGSVYFITDGESSGDFSNLENRVGALETSNQTAVHYKGVTTTALADGDTTNPITINGTSYTAVLGDVVAYSNREFVFDGTTWSEFGGQMDTVPTSGSANAVTSDGVYRYTAGQKYFVNNVVKGEVFNDTINNKATGVTSHAEGNHTTASGATSHSEGHYTTASGNYSHVEGYTSKASGNQSHAEGYSTIASGSSSHAEGYYTTASGANSHANGAYTIANKNASTAIGQYNVADTDVTHLLIVGNGTEKARSNILEVSTSALNVNGDIQKNGVGIDDYTTTERKIGKWIDGSYLYQRTFEVTGLVNKQWNKDVLGTTGIEIKEYTGYIYWLYNSNTSVTVPINSYRGSSEYCTAYVATDKDDLDVLPYMGETGISIDKAIITIKYTKPSVQANVLTDNIQQTEEPTDKMR